MFPYATESFTKEEETVLLRHFTNVDLPVFALYNLPEVVKGALFARYSRSDKSLRRLFLDEFADDVGADGDISTAGEARAASLYDKVFLDYGDDSVAQLGGVHLACEQASNLLTKILERGRLAAYLEQSTRYVPYDARLANGRYRYYRDPQVLGSPLGARYVAEMDRTFDAYGALLPKMVAHLAHRYPVPAGTSELAWRRSIRAQALDNLRGLLPAGSLSNVGIYASGQAYEQLLMRMRSSALTEARLYADLMLVELRKVVPSFLTRLDRPDRGGEWTAYHGRTRADAAAVATDLTSGLEPAGSPDVDLVDFDPAGEDKVLAAILYETTPYSDAQLAKVVEGLNPDQRQELLGAYVGNRTNRRQKPGRAFERTSYRFDIISDYGAFRDLQRHRTLTVEWQPLTPALGYEIPDAVVDAGFGATYKETMERSGALYYAMAEDFPSQAAYSLGLAWRIRYSMQLNARAAMHTLELRSSPQGHASYRKIAQQMHTAIDTIAGHHGIAGAMRFVDHGLPDLSRLEAEQRVEARLPKGVPANG